MTSRYLFPNLKRPSDTLRLLIVLALATVTLYWPATHHDFLVIDDWEYVVDNGHVNKGMSWEAARWAFTSYEASNWHPLTWLSHQADWSCYGPFAGGHHLTNLLLHTLNTLLLFLLLRRQTGNTSASWIVAALFGWHPLHVESVAWIAERKDLLSTLCLIGTLWAYTNYAQTRQSQADNPTDGGRARIWRWYGAALLVFAAGLMCKPMLVTLPCLLLLFDYWPLKRGADPLTGKSARDWVGLVAEKLAFFALSAAACMVTVAAQGQAIKDTAEVPFSLRLLNMLGSYGEYLRQVIWPYPLCIYYPLPNDLPVAQASTAALLLAAISWATVRYRRDCPWLLVGWLWLLGSLVPVIGLVQVGTQAHADRYMYIPSIGIFVAVVWTGQHLARHWRRREEIGLGLAASGLTLCLVLTHNQLRRWGNNVELMAYTLAHTQNNVVSQNNLGVALAIAGKPEEAIAHYRESLRIDPKGILARLNLGVQLENTGQLEEAARHFSLLLEQSPHSEVLLNNLGKVRLEQGQYQESLALFREAIRSNPEYSKAYYNAGVAQQAIGDVGAAVTNYNAALRLNPRSMDTLNRLADLLATCPIAPYHQPERAIRLAKQASTMVHDEVVDYLETLATAYAAAGQYTNAIAASQKALGLARGRVMPKRANKLLGDLQAYESGRIPELDWKKVPGPLHP